MNDHASESLQKSTAACLRALAERPDADISFGLISSQDGYGKVRIGTRGKDSVQSLRGESDAAASRLRHHDQDLHLSMLPGHYQAREIFEALEQVRTETLTAQRYRGVRQNLSAHYEELAAEADAPVARSVQSLAWRILALEQHPPAPPLAADWAVALEKARGDLLSHLSDQRAFAEDVWKLLRQMGLEQEAGPDEEPEQNESTESPTPSPQQADSPTPPPPAETPAGDMARQQQQNAAAHQEGESAKSAEAAQNMANPLPLSRFWDSEGQFPYKAFSTEFDEIISADKLCTPQELVSLRAALDQYLSYVPAIVTRLANKLQRKLLSQQARSWSYDQEEGLLDTSRLSRLVARPFGYNFHKIEKQTDFNDTVIGLLLDNSGSMRGRPIIIAALSADILARTLERCGVKVEILGFTTKSWKGGQVAEKWLAAGKPPHPGRLNDVRHIIYKSADQPWRRTRLNLGVMLREGLLKENIDGEALLWAHQRLLSRPEQRKILMVISDGAPVDDLTTSANGGVYLEQHLRGVIHWIEQKSPVELAAIGIGHDVTRYYENAVTISDVEQLGPVMLGQLGALFEK